jgi:hypothetical protein
VKYSIAHWQSRAVRLRLLGMPIAILAEHWQITLSQARRYCDPRAMEFSTVAQVEPRPVDWDTGKFVYGPLFARWVLGRHPRFSSGAYTNTPEQRLVHRALAGEMRPSFAAVDGLIAPLGLHVSEVPTHCWLLTRDRGEGWLREVREHEVSLDRMAA